MRQYYKSDIIKLAKPIENLNCFVVYFLLKEEEIVYVGQSKCLSVRLRNHAKDKDFNKYFSIPCNDEKDALQLEEHYIKTLNPVFNRVHNSLYAKRMPFVKVPAENITEPKKGILLVKSSLVVKVPIDSYERKYINKRFIWVFNIEGCLYQADFVDGESYLLNDRVFKPKQIKGSII